MREQVNFLATVIARSEVQAAALLGSDRSMLQSHFDERLAAIEELARSARPLFRDMSPELGHLSFTLESSRLVIVPVGSALLVLQVDREHEAADVLASLEPSIRTVANVSSALASVPEPLPPLQPDEKTTASPQSKPAPQSAPVPQADRELRSSPRQAVTVSRSAAEPAVTVPAASSREAILELLRRTVATARQRLGGPVIRNHLNKARQEVGGALLDAFSLGLDGSIECETLHELDAYALAAEVTPWLLEFIHRVRGHVPELDGVALSSLVGDLGECLAGTAIEEATRRSA